ARKSHDASHGWSRLLSSGKASQIVDEARAMGIDAAFSESPSSDLEALADAARYNGHDDIARGAFLAERRRFPNTAGASRAAFLMARLEEAKGQWSPALEWYETYLKDSRDGTYASDALAGKMVVVQRIYGNEKARAVADEYLRRFPNGSHA